MYVEAIKILNILVKIDDEDLNLSLIELIYFNHNNLIAICEYILNKI